MTLIIVTYGCADKNLFRLLCFVSLALTTATFVNSQRIATIQITTKGSERFEIPVQTNLDAITFLNDSLLQFSEIISGKKIAVPFQIESDKDRILHWLLLPTKRKVRFFEIGRTSLSPRADCFSSPVFSSLLGAVFA